MNNPSTTGLLPIVEILIGSANGRYKEPCFAYGSNGLRYNLLNYEVRDVAHNPTVITNVTYYSCPVFYQLNNLRNLYLGNINTSTSSTISSGSNYLGLHRLRHLDLSKLTTFSPNSNLTMHLYDAYNLITYTGSQYHGSGTNNNWVYFGSHDKITYINAPYDYFNLASTPIYFSKNLIVDGFRPPKTDNSMLQFFVDADSSMFTRSDSSTSCYPPFKAQIFDFNNYGEDYISSTLHVNNNSSSYFILGRDSYAGNNYYLKTIILTDDWDVRLDLSGCVGLDLNNITNMFEKLKDLTGLTVYNANIKFNPEVYSRLTSEQKEIATNKGWTIS